MDLALIIQAFGVRDESPDLEVHALTDRQVLDALNRQASRRARPKSRPTITYRDPTGEQATTWAERRKS